jgi:small subunit ribosomal protein S1
MQHDPLAPNAPAETSPASEAETTDATEADRANEPDVVAAADSASDNHEASTSGLDHNAGEQSAAEADAAGEANAASDSPAKKRRRKKKSGKSGKTEQGTENAKGNLKGEGAPAPFARFFEGASHAGRRSAFAAGEIVAGKVQSCLPHTSLIDLFGKAIAVIDEFEPRTPPPPDVVSPVQGSTHASTTESGADETEHAAEVAEARAAEPHVDVDATVDASGVAPLDTESAQGFSAAEVQSAEPSDAGAIETDSDANTDPSDQEDSGEVVGEVEADDERPEPLVVGHIVRGRVGHVADSGHVAIVNRKIDKAAVSRQLSDAQTQRKRVRGVVFGYNRGGFDVLVMGLRAFCPASGMALRAIEHPEEYIGQKLEFLIPVSATHKKGWIVSRKSILEREARKAAKERVKQLQVGERVRGKVTEVRPFGFFVDIGGIEGLVHQSEVSFDRTVRPEQAVKVGEEVETQILAIEDTKGHKDRIAKVALSLRATQNDPWNEHAELLREGTVVKGPVVRVTEFGAFIQLAPSIDGLLHVSEFGKDGDNLLKGLQAGQELCVVVERVDRKHRKISLSKLSAAEAKAYEEGTLTREARTPTRPGGHVSVVVDRVEHHGVYVQLQGVVGKRGRGYIPNSEMGTDKGTDHRKNFPQGAVLEVKIIGADRDGNLKLSRKGRVHDEERRAVQEYRKEAARQGFGTFGDLLRAKLGGDEAASK